MTSTLKYSCRKFVNAIECLVKEACVIESDVYIKISQNNVYQLNSIVPLVPEMKISFENRINIYIQNIVHTHSAAIDIDKELIEIRKNTDEVIKITSIRDYTVPIYLGEQNHIEFQHIKQDTKYLSQLLKVELDNYYNYTRNINSDLECIKLNTSHMVDSANNFFRAGTYVRVQHEEGNATATRLRQKYLSLLKGIIFNSRSFKSVFDGELNVCNQGISDIREDINEIAVSVKNVKSAIGGLVHEAILEHNSKSLQLARDHIDEVDKFDINLNKMKQSFDIMLKTFNENTVDMGEEVSKMTQEIKNAKGLMKELTAKIPRPDKGIPIKHAERKKHLNKLAKCIRGSKKLTNHSYNVFHIHINKIKDGVYNLAQDMHNMKEMIDGFAKVICVDQNVGSIIQDRQYLEQVQKYVYFTKTTKEFLDRTLTECAELTLETHNNLLETKIDVEEVKTYIQSLFDTTVYDEEFFSVHDHELRVDKIKKMSSNSTTLKNSFNNKMNICNKDMEVVKRKLHQMKKGVDYVNRTMDNLVLVAANNDIILKCNKMFKKIFRKVETLAYTSTSTKESLDHKIDYLNTNMNNSLEKLDKLDTLIQKFSKITSPGNNIKSIGFDKKTLNLIFSLYTDSKLIRKLFDLKLSTCNQQVSCIKKSIGYFNKIITNFTKINYDVLIGKNSTNRSRFTLLGKDNLDEISKLSLSSNKLKDIIDLKINLYSDNFDYVRTQTNRMNYVIFSLMKELNEAKNHVYKAKKMLLIISENFQLHNKRQRIEWALCNISTLVENFQFKRISTRSSKPESLINSHVLIKRILMAFREGAGLYLPVDAIKVDHDFNEKIHIQEKKKKFRDTIINQVTRLTGFRPVITEKDGGKICIFSS